MPRTVSTLHVDGRTLTVSNLEKVLYPEAGFTKRDVIAYFMAIAPVLLPHLRNRALTMKRYPDGAGKFFFYEKNCPPLRPAWVKTATVYSHGRGANMSYCLANNLASLVWMANLADLELHTLLDQAQKITRPTTMVFDLDPGEGADVLHCAQVAFWLKEKLETQKLENWVKTSGSKGLQLYVPLNTPVTFAETKAAARQLGDTLVSEHPEAVVTKMRKTLRRNKVLIDWSQNDEHKTGMRRFTPRHPAAAGLDAARLAGARETPAARRPGGVSIFAGGRARAREKARRRVRARVEAETKTSALSPAAAARRQLTVCGAASEVETDARSPPSRRGASSSRRSSSRDWFSRGI